MSLVSDEPFKTPLVNHLQCESFSNDDSIPASSSPLLPAHLIKRGYREMTSHLTCGVIFDGDPVWLWSIRPNSWSKIYVSGPDFVRIRQDHNSLFLKLESKLVTIASTFESDYPSISPDFMWISGSGWFIDLLSLPPVGCHVYWLCKSGRRLPSDQRSIQWSRINHFSVGGVTNARATFGVDKRSDPIRIRQDLKRSIGHVIKYSERPQVCNPDTSVTHYVLSDVLSISFPRRPVLYPTHMSRTGWGIRPLTNEELATCFELPGWVPWNDRFLEDIVPLQLFRAVMDSVTESTLLEPPRSKPRKVEMVGDSHHHQVSTDVIWLASVGRWLPGSWADVEISDKAVKSDNAPVDFKPWHRRIQLVLPCSIDSLGRMERFSSRIWRRNVCRSLFRYIRFTYGVSWRRDVFLGMSKRSLADHAEGAEKRCRFSPSARSSGGEGVDPECKKPEFTSGSLHHLRLDLKRGLRVLGQVLQSTWWDWTSGSAPLFWRWNGQEQVIAARDGMKTFVQSTLPRSRKGVRPPRFDPETRKLVSSKVESMVSKSYLENGHVKTSLHYFAVPKGDSDIRVVFDGTSCGLNDSLWSPNFFLPTSKNAAEMLSFNSWMADVDFGEFFHNFFADETIRKHSGVEVSCLAPFFPVSCTDGQSNFKFTGLRWSRLFMGSKPSPYNAVLLLLGRGVRVGKPQRSIKPTWV